MARKTDGKIFISYRRSDAVGVAGRLNDTLGEYFGHHRVFRDIEDIAGGADFGDVIEGNLDAADAVIVLIGPDWATTKGADGSRRLDDPDDWVVAEIAAALENGVPVYPVLIDDTPMPRAEDLPPRLHPLLRRNAVTISDGRWKTDVTRLAKIVAFDIPGSVAERQLDRIRWLVVLSLIASTLFTTAMVAINARDLLDAGQSKPDLFLAESAAAVNFIAIMGAAIFLLIVVPFLDEAKRHWMKIGAWVGIAGTLITLVLYWKPFEGTDETIAAFAGSSVLIVVMLGFMVLSGFKPK